MIFGINKKSDRTLIANEMKKCPTCKKRLSLLSFYKNISKMPDCKICYQKKKRINNRFKRRFGTTVLEYRLKKNNFAINFPNLLTTWNYKKNNSLRIYPDKVFQNSTKKVWWSCKKHGDYLQAVVNRSSGRGCKDCGNLKIAEKVIIRSIKKFGNLLESFPEIFDEVNFDLHTKEEILKKSVYSHENINWKCKKCGNNWVTTIKNRTKNKSNCKRCKGGIISRNEYRLFCELSSLFIKVYLSYKIHKKKYVDIYIKDLNLVIEYDGYYYHRNKLDNDFLINKEILDLNFNIIRIREHNLVKINNSDIVIKTTDTSNKNQLKIALILIKKIKEKYSNKISKKNLNKIDQYLEKKKFMNSSKYNKFIACLPFPPPQNSIEYYDPRVRLIWDNKKNNPFKPNMFRQTDKIKVWIKCKNNHSEFISVGDIKRRIDRKSFNNKICSYCS